MSFRLKEAVFKVRCREPGCIFFHEFSVKENIMGATEADVDTEALKIARNLGYIKHDALFGRKHQLASPEVTKISATYDRIGPAVAVPTMAPTPAAASAPTAPARTYRRGETIIRKGESAVTVCEVLRGTAYNINHQELLYKAGSTFGAAALFRQKSRLGDVVAGEDGTTIAFHNIRELTRTNPAKARELYDEAMEDIFQILVYLEDLSSGLEKKVKKLEAENLTLKAGKRPTAAKARPKKAPKAKKPVVKAKKKTPARKKPAPKKAKRR